MQQEKNCVYFLATWMLWEYQRQICNTVLMCIRYFLRSKKSQIPESFLHRLAYVRHAPSILKDGFKVLYISLFVFFLMYVLNRNLSWTFVHLLHGTNIYRMPKGIFCLERNLTEVIKNIDKSQRKEYYSITSYRGIIGVIANTICFDIVITFFFMASLKSR